MWNAPTMLRDQARSFAALRPCGSLNTFLHIHDILRLSLDMSWPVDAWQASHSCCTGNEWYGLITQLRYCRNTSPHLMAILKRTLVAGQTAFAPSSESYITSDPHHHTAVCGPINHPDLPRHRTEAKVHRQP